MIRLRRAVIPFAAIVCCPGLASAHARTYRAELRLPPRLQWLANYGYCGETAFVASALHFGEYLSQYEARSLASSQPQSRAGSQLLPGVNVGRAARAARLDAVDWRGAGSAPFLVWVKHQVAAGHPVLAGLFENGYYYGAGDSEYDHVVLIDAVSSRHPLRSARAYRDDTFTFSDNGLWNPDGWSPAHRGVPKPRYLFTDTDGTAQLSRAQANSRHAPVYSIKRGGTDYGDAIAGVDDPRHETVPVTLATSVNYEWPQMLDGKNTPPRPSRITLTATARGLTVGRRYRVYTYDRLATIPNRDFNAHAAAAASAGEFTARARTQRVSRRTIESNRVLAYRVVPAVGS